MNAPGSGRGVSMGKLQKAHLQKLIVGRTEAETFAGSLSLPTSHSRPEAAPGQLHGTASGQAQERAIRETPAQARQTAAPGCKVRLRGSPASGRAQGRGACISPSCSGLNFDPSGERLGFPPLLSPIPPHPKAPPTAKRHLLQQSLPASSICWPRSWGCRELAEAVAIA